MEHIVTLPSDASYVRYPDNKIGNYTVDLDPPIDLSLGDWEVSLLDINYPTKWTNVLDQYEMLTTFHVRGRHFCIMGIPPGSYNTKSFIKAFILETRKMWRYRHHRHVRRASITRKGQFVLPTHTSASTRRKEIIFSKSLANALGVFGFSPIQRNSPQDGSFLLHDNVLPKHVADELRGKPVALQRERRKKYKKRRFTVPDETGLGFQIKNKPSQYEDRFTFPHKVDPNINFRHFTVQTNIIEPDALGRRDLRIFVPQSMTETAEIVHKEFSTPHFKPISKGLESLKTISIKIVDELGRPVKFTGGKASVTLCLRQRRH